RGRTSTAGDTRWAEQTMVDGRPGAGRRRRAEPAAMRVLATVVPCDRGPAARRRPASCWIVAGVFRVVGRAVGPRRRPGAEPPGGVAATPAAPPWVPPRRAAGPVVARGPNAPWRRRGQALCCSTRQATSHARPAPAL